VNHKQPHAILEYNGTLTHEWFTQQPTEVAASPRFVYVPMTGVDIEDIYSELNDITLCDEWRHVPKPVRDALIALLDKVANIVVP